MSKTIPLPEKRRKSEVNVTVSSCKSPECHRECPVCLDELTIPVYQCTNGHVICKLCLEKVVACPICRERMPQKRIRNLILENFISSGVIFDCPYRISGCMAVLKEDEVETHKLECSFKKKNYCQLLGFFGCNAKYRRLETNELLTHLVLDHSFELLLTDDDFHSNATVDKNENIASEKWEMEYRSDVAHRDFSQLLQSKSDSWLSPGVIKFDQHLFFIKKYFDAPSKSITIVVCMDGSAEVASWYSVSFRLAGGRSPVPCLTFESGKVFPLAETTAFIENSGEIMFTLPCRQMEQFGRNGSPRSNNLFWKFEVTVRKNSLPVPIRIPSGVTIERGGQSKNDKFRTKSGAGAVSRMNLNSSYSSSNTVHFIPEEPGSRQEIMGTPPSTSGIVRNEVSQTTAPRQPLQPGWFARNGPELYLPRGDPVRRSRPS